MIQRLVRFAIHMSGKITGSSHNNLNKPPEILKCQVSTIDPCERKGPYAQELDRVLS